MFQVKAKKGKVGGNQREQTTNILKHDLKAVAGDFTFHLHNYTLLL